MKKFCLPFIAVLLLALSISIPARSATSVLIWGNTGTTVPGPLSAQDALAGKTVTAISSTQEHTLAVTSEGRAYAWGNNVRGQLGIGGVGGYVDYPFAVDTTGVLAGKTIVAVAAGSFHSLALDSDGKVYGWGGNDHGELGNGKTKESEPLPVAVKMTGVMAGKKIVAIAAGFWFSVALDSEGRVYCWGNNESGTLGNGTRKRSLVPVAVDITGALAGKKLVKVKSGAYCTLALDSAGRLYGWGSNGRGQLGSETISGLSPVAVDTSGALKGKIVTSMASGDYVSMATDSSGHIYAWGLNDYAQLGDSTTYYSATPIDISNRGSLAGRKFVGVAIGTTHSLALDDFGRVHGWGQNIYGNVGDGTKVDRSVPVLVKRSGAMANSFVTQIGAGWYNSVALVSGNPATSITVDSPLNNSIVKNLAALNGTVVARAGSIAKVELALRRTVGSGPSEYWAKRGDAWNWGPDVVRFSVVTSEGKWAVRTGAPAGTKLPAGTDLPDAAYYVAAYATNRSGDNANAAASFRLDSTPPTLNVASPIPGSFISALDAIGGSVQDNTDGSGLDKVEFVLRRNADGKYWNGSEWGASQALLATRIKDGIWSAYAPLPSARNGNLPLNGKYTVQAWATDKSGSKSTVVARSEFTIDKDAPSITITSPADKAVQKTLPSISGTAIDVGGGVAQVQLELDRVSPFGTVQHWIRVGSNWKWSDARQRHPAAFSGNSWTAATGKPAGFTLPSGALLVDCEYVVTAYVYDKAGNLASVESRFLVDNTAPAGVTIESPYEGYGARDLDFIAGKAYDSVRDPKKPVHRAEIFLRRTVSSGFEYWANRESIWAWGKTPQTMPARVFLSEQGKPSWVVENDANTTMPQYRLGELADGEYAVQARAFDEAGNMASTWRFFKVDHVPPVVTVTTPAHGSTLKALPAINGTATDNAGGAGMSAVQMQLTRIGHEGANEWWTNDAGLWHWVSYPVEISIGAVTGNKWAFDTGPPFYSKLPAGEDLTPGQYQVTVRAFDKAGTSGFAYSDFTIEASATPTPTPTPPPAIGSVTRSHIGLSSVRAEAGKSTVTLVFSGALSSASATEAARYSVQINGAAADVESAASRGGNTTVVLGLAQGSVHAGDVAVVTYNLLDSHGGSLVGSATVTAK